MTDITVAGKTFNVLVEGDENKEVLILSNPLATNLHIWGRQIPALLEHFRVVRYDSRGHGASVANEGPYSIEGLGHDTLAIMDALGIAKVHWLGSRRVAWSGYGFWPMHRSGSAAPCSPIRPRRCPVLTFETAAFKRCARAAWTLSPRQ